MYLHGVAPLHFLEPVSRLGVIRVGVWIIRLIDGWQFKVLDGQSYVVAFLEGATYVAL
jgi:hypothetical protein